MQEVIIEIKEDADIKKFEGEFTGASGKFFKPDSVSSYRAVIEWLQIEQIKYLFHIISKTEEH